MTDTAPRLLPVVMQVHDLVLVIPSSIERAMVLDMLFTYIEMRRRLLGF